MTNSSTALPSLTDALRRGRRRADLSQRQLAEQAGVSQSMVARAEVGDTRVPIGVIAQLLTVLDLVLVCVDTRGGLDEVMAGDARDRAGRRFPPHLDVRPVGKWGTWWGDEHCVDLPEYNPARPAHTYELDRRSRDYRRARLTAPVGVQRARVDVSGTS